MEEEMIHRDGSFKYRASPYNIQKKEGEITPSGHLNINVYKHYTTPRWGIAKRFCIRRKTKDPFPKTRKTFQNDIMLFC